MMGRLGRAHEISQAMAIFSRLQKSSEEHRTHRQRQKLSNFIMFPHH